MKPLTLFITTLLLSFTTKAQIAHDFEIYSENGDKFTLIVNGRTMNSEPVDRITIENIQHDYVQIVIDFEDESIPNIEEKYLSLCNPELSERDKPVISIFRIIEKKGKYKLRIYSRSNKKIQGSTVIINQQQQTEQNGVNISKGRVVINW